MAAIATEVEPDVVISLQLVPGTYRAFRDAVEEGGPRLKCYEGSVLLVAPKDAHETVSDRISSLILAVCLEFRVAHLPLESTTWDVSTWMKDTGYEADRSYYIQSFGKADPGYRPDLAVEVVNTHKDTKARQCGEALKIPELWVYNVRRRQMTFLGLSRQGPHKGTYQPIARSRALPWLRAAEVEERLADPVEDATLFHENCRRWARRVLRTRDRG
jgi:Uma2 family endonuclease